MRRFHKKLTVLFLIFLVGCVGHRTQTGGTNVSSKSYFCRGSWHHPQNYYEYDETGLASWYGDDFHGLAKATGENFHKMSLTAAHKTLPLPSVVKVTDLKTGRSIVVVIDDRGPFVYRGRLIDLSYGAAKALGIENKKPQMVRIQTLVEDSLKLSNYIANHCHKRKDPWGRSWSEIYRQEIKGEKLHMYEGQQFSDFTTPETNKILISHSASKKPVPSSKSVISQKQVIKSHSVLKEQIEITNEMDALKTIHKKKFVNKKLVKKPTVNSRNKRATIQKKIKNKHVAQPIKKSKNKKASGKTKKMIKKNRK